MIKNTVMNYGDFIKSNLTAVAIGGRSIHNMVSRTDSEVKQIFKGGPRSGATYRNVFFIPAQLAEVAAAAERRANREARRYRT